MISGRFFTGCLVSQAVDLFPDTPHCELFVAFVRETAQMER